MASVRLLKTARDARPGEEPVRSDRDKQYIYLDASDILIGLKTSSLIW